MLLQQYMIYISFHTDDQSSSWLAYVSKNQGNEETCVDTSSIMYYLQGKHHLQLEKDTIAQSSTK